MKSNFSLCLGLELDISNMEMKERIDLLAELSGLKIEDDEREKLVADMDSILGYVDKLKELDIESKSYIRVIIDGDDCREDVVVGASEAERRAVLASFPAITKDNLLEAHAVLDHKV